MTTQQPSFTKPQSKGALWAGRIINGLVILFLLFDAVMKIIKEIHSIEGSAKLGWPVDAVQGLGIVLLIGTLIYMIPRLALFGAVLVTAYLGGAVAIMFRAGQPFFFPIIFGILLWVGYYFRSAKLRMLIS
jgi:hypothetical protein